MIHQDLSSRFRFVFSKYHPEVTELRKSKLFREVLAGYAHIKEAYPEWEQAFSDGSIIVDVGQIETSPLFTIWIGIYRDADSEMIEATKACPTMTTSGLGFYGYGPAETRFLNDCWNDVLRTVLTQYYQVPAVA